VITTDCQLRQQFPEDFTSFDLCEHVPKVELAPFGQQHVFRKMRPTESFGFSNLFRPINDLSRTVLNGQFKFDAAAEQGLTVNTIEERLLSFESCGEYPGHMCRDTFKHDQQFPDRILSESVRFVQQDRPPTLVTDGSAAEQAFQIVNRFWRQFSGIDFDEILGITDFAGNQAGTARLADSTGTGNPKRPTAQ